MQRDFPIQAGAEGFLLGDTRFGDDPVSAPRTRQSTEQRTKSTAWRAAQRTAAPPGGRRRRPRAGRLNRCSAPLPSPAASWPPLPPSIRSPLHPVQRGRSARRASYSVRRPGREHGSDRARGYAHLRRIRPEKGKRHSRRAPVRHTGQSDGPLEFDAAADSHRLALWRALPAAPSCPLLWLRLRLRHIECAVQPHQHQLGLRAAHPSC
jgi:hypothetical protein